jgi:tRNA(fMet)-specific endonuclease VapC
MTYLVDTDYVADFLKGYQKATLLLQHLSSAGLAISIITFAEVYEGIYSGQNRRQHEQGFRAFLDNTSLLSRTRPVARQFARLRGALRAKGQLIPDPDLFIAATAIQHHLTLVTRNRKDYERIPNLRLYQNTDSHFHLPPPLALSRSLYVARSSGRLFIMAKQRPLWCLMKSTALVAVAAVIR